MDNFRDKIVENLIANKPSCECCKISFLYAFVLCNSEFEIKNKQPLIIFKFFNDDVKKYVEEVLIESFGIDSFKTIKENKKTEIILNEKISEQLFFNFQIDNIYNLQINENIFMCEDCKKWFTKGMFLNVGKTNISASKDLQVSSGHGYKINFTLNKLSVLESFANMLAENEIDVKIILGEINNLTISDFESVRNFLYFMGANKSILSLDNISIEREMRSKIVREVNATENNIKRTIENSSKLYEMCKTIDEIIGIDKLPSNLKQICLIALENEGLSLNEIAKRIGGNITKSGVNHRIRSLREIYNNIAN